MFLPIAPFHSHRGALYPLTCALCTLLSRILFPAHSSFDSMKILLRTVEEDDLDDVDMLQAHKRVVLRRVRELKASGLPPSTPAPSISASSSS